MIDPVEDDDRSLATQVQYRMMEALSEQNKALQEEIAQRKKLHQEVIDTNASLEQRVQRRTKELQQSNRQLNDELVRRKQAEERLAHLANTDELTGINNRRSFFSKGEKLITNPNKVSCFFLLIDLDHFKLINDTHGHAIGDLVLETVGKHIEGSVRTSGARPSTHASDIAGRLGGEEFGVLLVSDDLATAILVAERIRETLAETVIEVGNDTITVTGSFGLTEYIVGEGLDEFYQRADKACYGAKDAGRNCLVIERIEANSRSGTKEAVDRPDGTVDHGTN